MESRSAFSPGWVSGSLRKALASRCVRRTESDRDHDHSRRTRTIALVFLLHGIRRRRTRQPTDAKMNDGVAMSSEITIYSAQWCADCRRTKRYLETNDIPFTLIDLEENPEEIEAVIAYNGGRKSIPVVVFPDGSHLTEPSDEEMDAKLGR